jgi:hypothetical protein
MVATNEALPARAEVIIPIIVSQLYDLVHPTATISQVRCLRRPEVDIEALFVT